MQQSNAILAINSLDRYITPGGVSVSSFFIATWAVATPNVLIRVSGQAILGATLTTSAIPAPGWPVGVVTVVGIFGDQITISANVTADSGGPQPVFEAFSYSNAAQPTSNVLAGNFLRSLPNCNDFTISSPGALIYGYIDRIVVSQIQLQYNIPTVCRLRNDLFFLGWESPTGTPGFSSLTIPFGFYTPVELATALQAEITAAPSFAALGLTVSFDSNDGFYFESTTNYKIFAADPGFLIAGGSSNATVDRILKTYKLFGLTNENGLLNPTSSTPTFQRSSHYPDFLYTPYIDIFSDVLTNYQNVKDTNTSIAKPKGLVARVLLSGGGNIQITNGDSALGSAPFVMTADLNNPKVIKWSPDVAVPSIDFQLRDCYGDLIPGVTEKYPTEFQMTLLCIEG
jgi:hypothetical protein